MNSKKKIQLIAEILDRYDDGACLYCGSTLNGGMESDDFDEGYPDDWCPCLLALDKVIHDKKFVP
jgi:hypothetical protein